MFSSFVKGCLGDVDGFSGWLGVFDVLTSGNNRRFHPPKWKNGGLCEMCCVVFFPAKGGKNQDVEQKTHAVNVQIVGSLKTFH